MEVKDVAENAAAYLKKFFPKAERIQLEEIEISDDDKFWNITLSYDDQPTEPGGFIFGGISRFYKIFKVDAKDGSVRSMKIRNIK